MENFNKLESLKIENFRLFKTLEVPTLSNINLFVGKNNSGKSCLLEAVYLYYSKFQGFFNLISDREENWKNQLSEEKIKENIESPIRHLFYGYHYLESNSLIKIGSLKNINNSIKLALQEEKEEADFTSRTIKFLELNETNDDISNSKNKPRIVFITSWNDQLIDITDLGEIDNYVYRPSRRLFRPKEKNSSSLQIQKISANGKSLNNIALLWDNISLSEEEKDVISSLQIIEPQITRIGLLGELRERIPVIILENTQERLPLKNFGDGLYRLFCIALAAVNAKNGVLIIDEVENGLHWSVHNKLWNLLFNLSKKLNIQIFATTHSRDCVRGFNEIWSKDHDNASFYRLERYKDGDIEAINYNQDTLNAALYSGVEFL